MKQLDLFEVKEDPLTFIQAVKNDLATTFTLLLFILAFIITILI